MRIKYVCSACQKSGVKLWRQYSKFLEHISLLCYDCALVDQHMVAGWVNKRGGDQIGWMIPACPTELPDPETHYMRECETFWGYTSTPDDKYAWWASLPSTRPEGVTTGEVWENKKTGTLYKVMCLAKHSVTQEMMVVYSSLDSSSVVWVRPIGLWRTKFHLYSMTDSER